MSNKKIRKLAEQLLEIKDNQTRWMVLGYLTEQGLLRQAETKKPRGRPKTGADKDGWRAYTLWAIAQNFPTEKRAKFSNRELISIARQLEEIQELPLQERAFPHSNNLEQSVSRGKTKHGIDEFWNSEVCEKIGDI